MKKILYLLFLSSVASAMQPEDVRRNVDANGYRYRDENTIQDKRKIAILSYGSLVNQPANLTTGARLEATAFQPTDIQLPVSLMRESSNNTPQRRITAVVDRDGDLKRVWAATSRFQFMPNARNNLAAREGARLQSQDAGYDLANIFYMKKLVPGRMRDSNEEIVPGVDGWVIRTAANNRQQLPVEVQQNVARWANAQGYSAVIWASFPPNISNREEVIRRLAEDDTLLRNTQEYVRNLPDGAQSALERVILVGKDALRTLVERRAAREQQAGASQRVTQNQSPIRRQLTQSVVMTPSLNDLLMRYPLFFSDIPENMKIELAKYIEKELRAANSRNLYDLFPFWSQDPPEKWIQKAQWLALGRMLNFNPLPAPGSDFIIFEIMPSEPEDLGSFREFSLTHNPFDAVRVTGNSKVVAQKFTQFYKIHLMPADDISSSKILAIILNAYMNDSELKKLVPIFKIAPKSLQKVIRGEMHVIPAVVLYTKNGTEATQKALNKIYHEFVQHPEIRGSGIRPRFNAKVNDLIWIAQGNGDNKGGQYSQYYEPPFQAYYRKDITGEIENYHLKHPETGRELID
jgi:hypothetical protein